MKTNLTLLTLAAAIAFGQTPTVKLDWPANPANTGTVAYNVYRCTGTCALPNSTFTKITTQPVAALTYTDAAVTPGSTYIYRVTSVRPDGTLESGPSPNSNAAVIPLAPPGTPTAVPLNLAWQIKKDDGTELASGAERFFIPVAIPAGEGQ